MDPSLVCTLTPREKEIFILIAEGKSIAEISHELHRSQKTIESHRLAIGRKLKASNRVKLVKIAIAAGLIEINQINQQSEESLAVKQTPTLAELELAWLEEINDEIGDAVGGALIERFCRSASRLPSVDFARICTLDHAHVGMDVDPKQRLAIAMCARGGPPVSSYSDVVNTPCRDVIDRGEYFVQDHVATSFPDDPWLAEVGARAYLGVGLVTQEGKKLGGVSLVARQPIAEPGPLHHILGFFAPRLSGALQVIGEVNALRSQCDDRR